MDNKLSSEVTGALTFVLEWASCCGLDTVVFAAAKTLSENNCDVPQGFNQRRWFFQALLSVRKVDYCAGKENFIDILSVFDEIEKVHNTHANAAHFKWASIRKTIIFQIGICKMREILRVPDIALYDFDIPSDFNYSSYQSTMRTLGSVYYDNASDVDEFVAAFTTDLLTKKQDRKFFSKRKTNSLCQAHSLEDFQKNVGDFLNSLQSAVLPVPKLIPQYVAGVVDPLLQLQHKDATNEQKATAGPYANGSTPAIAAPSNSGGSSSSSSSSSSRAPVTASSQRLPASPPLTAPTPTITTAAAAARNAPPPPPKKATAPVAAAGSSAPVGSPSGGSASSRNVRQPSMLSASTVTVPAPIVVDDWMESGRKRKLEPTPVAAAASASNANKIARKSNIINGKSVRKASKIEFDSDIESSTKPEESDNEELDLDEDAAEELDEDIEDDEDEDEEEPRHKSSSSGSSNHGGRSKAPTKKDAVLRDLGLSSAGPSQSRTRWSLEEEEALIQGLEDYGTNWRSILDDRRWSNIWRANHRTNVNLKDKYRTLLKHGIVKQY